MMATTQNTDVELKAMSLEELNNLFMLVRSLGGRCAIDRETITIDGIQGIATHQMSFTSASERIREVVSRKAGKH